jgi:protoporphyrinogen oxidase
MKNILHIIIVLAMAAAVVSCALVPMDVNKVLELKPDQKIYTAYNIWYENKDDISQLNYHKGKILPFGTEVNIFEATKESVVFQDINTCETYRVVFIRRNQIARTELYFKNLFTVKNAEALISGIKPDILQKIKSGAVEKGMTKREVLLSYGYPSPHRTPSLNDNTWIYFDDAAKNKRVIFSTKGLVLEIMKDEQEKK